MLETTPLSVKLAEFVYDAKGKFYLKDIYNALEIYSICKNTKCEILAQNPSYESRKKCPHCDVCISRDRTNIKVQVLNLVKNGLLEHSSRAPGLYRKVDKEKTALDLNNADPDVFLDVRWPFGLERLIRTMPKFLGVIAGASGAGKSALLLDFCVINVDKWPVHYFANGEMTASRIKKRLMNHPNIGMVNMDNFHAWEREANFADVIEPDGINVIDYLSVSSENPKTVEDDLSSILSKLKTGMVFVAIQKRTNFQDPKGKVWRNDLGVGGEWSYRKSDLYIVLDHYPENTLRITKARERTNDHVNPVGMEWGFKLVNGIHFRDIVDPVGIPAEQPQQVSIDIDFGGEEA